MQCVLHFEALGHLQTDEASADDHRLLGVARLDPGLNLATVRNIAQLENSRSVRTVDVRDERTRARGKDQLVVRNYGAVGKSEARRASTCYRKRL